MLTEMQQFTSSLVYNQVRPPKVVWSEDVQRVSVDGETLRVDKLRSGIQLALESAWDIYDSIGGGKRYADNLPDSFSDNLPNDTHGYSFLSHGPFTRHRHALLRHIIQD